jgi:putative transposase
VEAGQKAEDLARETGILKHTIHGLKAKYAGIEVSEARIVKKLRGENAR